MRPGRVLSAGASVPMKLGCVRLPACWSVHQCRSSLNPILLRFFYGGFINYAGLKINSISSSSPLSGELGSGGGADNPKLLDMAWFFWWPAPIKEPIKCHLIRTKDTLITQEIPRDLGTLSGTRIKDQILERKMVLVPLSLRKLQGFLEFYTRNQGQRPIYIRFLLFCTYALQTYCIFH